MVCVCVYIYIYVYSAFEHLRFLRGKFGIDRGSIASDIYLQDFLSSKYSEWQLFKGVVSSPSVDPSPTKP